MKAAGVNPVDNYVASGMYPQVPPLPFTAGCDGAGLVEKVGPNVTNFKACAFTAIFNFDAWIYYLIYLGIGIQGYTVAEI